MAGSLLAGVSGGALAVSDAEFAELKAQFAEMAQRMSALEEENRRLKLQRGGIVVEDLSQPLAELESLKRQNEATGWAENIQWKGDFRYRHEAIDIEDADIRRRQRIRARGAMVSQLPNNTEIGLGLATGGDDPVSTNQTLGGGGSSKEIRLDLAYFKWQVLDDIFLMGGKFKNPYYTPNKSALIFDGDYRPEGFAAGWRGDMFFASVDWEWLESDSARGNDAFAWGVQGGIKVPLGDASLTTALAYHDFPVKGETPFFDDDFFGNSSVNGVYKFDYQVVQLAADLSMNVGDMPLSVFADLIQNQDADDYENGYVLGARLGKAKGWGTWQLQYQYQDLEADATLGLISDSDFAGGGTDGKGHRLSGAFGISRQWTVGFTWFIDNEAGEKGPGGPGRRSRL